MPEEIVYPTDLDSGQMDDIVFTQIEKPEEKEEQETEESTEETQETEEKSEKEEGDQEKEGEESEEKSKEDDSEEEAKEEKPEKEEKADKWSEEDLKYLESKGWKDVEFNERNAAIIKSNREGQQRISDLSSTNSNHTTNLADLTQIVLSPNPKDIEELRKSMGAEEIFDTRTDEDRIKEKAENHDKTYNFASPHMDKLESLSGELRQQNDPLANKVANIIDGIVGKMDSELLVSQNAAQKEIDEINLNKKVDKRISNLGLPLNNKTPIYKKWKTQAEANYVDIMAKDPKAKEYIEAATKLLSSDKGKTVFETLGVTTARAFGTSMASANQFVRIGANELLAQKLESGELEKELRKKILKEDANKDLPPPKGQGKSKAAGQKNSAWINSQLETIAQQQGVA